MSVSQTDPVLPAAPARSDVPFVVGLSILGGAYVVLILAMLLADLAYTSPGDVWEALASREIQYAIKLSLLSCSITSILSVWVAVPLGYLLSRYRFRGKALLDAVLDIPIVLPPLVIGLSLLILFQTPPGRAFEDFADSYLGIVVAYVVVPLAAALVLYPLLKVVEGVVGQRLSRSANAALSLLGAGLLQLLLVSTPLGDGLQAAAQERFGGRITYGIASVILAQFAVACAFAVRTMRVTFDQISPRQEQVALTLGCSQSEAFWYVLLPAARRGVITAQTLAWARALGEFGPILVFSGATRLHTEVLSTTVFLELSVGRIEAAVAVSLLMVVAAVIVLIIVRVYGMENPAASEGKRP